MMFRFVLLALWMFFAQDSYAKKTKELRILFPPNPPAMYVDQSTGKASGHIVDYFHQTFSDLYSISWSPVKQLARAYESIEKGDYDLTFSGQDNPFFSKRGLHPSNVIFYSSEAIVIVNHNVVQEAGKKLNIAFQKGGYLPQGWQGQEFNFLEISGENANQRLLMLLESGRVDGIFTPVHWTFVIELARRGTISRFKPLRTAKRVYRNFYLVFRPSLAPEDKLEIDKRLQKTEKHRQFGKILHQECFKLAGSECDRFK